jgi:hypothetical protein
MGRVLVRMGRSQEAREILAGLRKMSHGRFIPAVDCAMVHLGLGEVDALLSACSVRERTVEQASPGRSGSLFAPLRQHASYRALLSEVFRGQSAIQSLLV